MLIKERPQLYGNMLKACGMGIRQIALTLQERFGKENYDKFREAQKREEYIPQETRVMVDRKVYADTEQAYNLPAGEGESLFQKALKRSDIAVNFAHHKLFGDQDSQATLTVDIAWSDRRASTVLERLTKPARFIGEQCRAEQFRQLALAVLSAEEIIEDENSDSEGALREINNVLWNRGFFIGKEGDPGNFHTYSYHTPRGNKLVGLSQQYPDQKFQDGLWVKSLDYPVREIAIRDENGNIKRLVKAYYKQDEKEWGARVIKGLHRSLTASDQLNGGKVEMLPHMQDTTRFRLVVIGDRSLRDVVTKEMQGHLQAYYDQKRVKDDDVVNLNNGNGKQDRFVQRRSKIYTDLLKRPVEAMILSLEDYISQLYEVGEFDPILGMHNGPAHDLYKLDQTAFVAGYLWHKRPFPKVDIEGAKKYSSYEIAARLSRANRISPSPYEG